MQSNTGDTGSLPAPNTLVNQPEDDTASGTNGADIIGLYDELMKKGPHSAIEEKVKEVRVDVERLERRVQLLLPSSQKKFVAAIWWMIQQGSKVKDLEALRRAGAGLGTYHFPFKEESIKRLLKLAEQRVIERLNDPATVARRGEKAYRLNRDKWERKYKGEYIAIYGGAVVANDADKSELLRKIVSLQKSEWPFRAYIVEVGAPPPPVMRGPAHRIGRRKPAGMTNP